MVAEAALRTVVAETLGVDADALAPEVSLVDDLAADSLDLAELVVRVESELGITIADRVIERVRTYGELVHAAVSAPRTAPLAVPGPDDLPLRARLVSPRGELLRVEAFTPYAAQTITDAAVAAGHGAFLELTLPADTTDVELADVTSRFTSLRDHGVVVYVCRGDATSRSVAA